VRGFYVWITVLLSAMVLLGFWPYFSGLASGKARTYWIVHLHAAVFAGWLALLGAYRIRRECGIGAGEE
jgi:hypothetical protein